MSQIDMSIDTNRLLPFVETVDNVTKNIPGKFYSPEYDLIFSGVESYARVLCDYFRKDMALDIESGYFLYKSRAYRARQYFRRNFGFDLFKSPKENFEHLRKAA